MQLTKYQKTKNKTKNKNIIEQQSIIMFQI